MSIRPGTRTSNPALRRTKVAPARRAGHRRCGVHAHGFAFFPALRIV